MTRKKQRKPDAIDPRQRAYFLRVGGLVERYGEDRVIYVLRTVLRLAKTYHEAGEAELGPGRFGPFIEIFFRMANEKAGYEIMTLGDTLEIAEILCPDLFPERVSGAEH